MPSAGIEGGSVPIYEYECTKCGHRFEKIQKFSDPMLRKCPECGGKIEQMISAPAIQFKGSGWYVNDYAKKPAAAPSGKNGKENVKAEASEGKSESKSESKPETDSKPKSDHSHKKEHSKK